MSFAASVTALFPQDIQARGADYYRRGRVSIEGMEGERVAAEVVGKRLYDVLLVVNDRGLSVSCTCPQFQKWRVPCKHMWATVLAADAGGFRPVPCAVRSVGPTRGGSRLAPVAVPLVRGWQKVLDAVYTPPGDASAAAWPARREVEYALMVERSREQGHAVIALRTRDPRKSGAGWCAPKALRLDVRAVGCLPDPADRDTISALSGAMAESYWRGAGRVFSEYLLTPHQTRILLPRIVATGRCFVDRPRLKETVALRLDPTTEPWRFVSELVKVSKGYALRGRLQRGEDVRELSATALCLTDGWVLWPEGLLAPLDVGAGQAWMEFFRRQREIVAPASEADELLVALLGRPDLPPLVVPPALALSWQTHVPAPCLRLRWPRTSLVQGLSQMGELTYQYGSEAVNPYMPNAPATLYNPGSRVAIRRDLQAEREREAELTGAGFRRTPYSEDPLAPFEIAAVRVPEALAALAGVGWRVESEGKPLRHAGAYSLSVSSGVDWFEVRGRIAFDGVSAEMPALLAALRKNMRVVTLSDGSMGLLDDDVLKRLAPLLGMGEVSRDGVRFKRNQAGLLDALLAAEPDATCDEAFLQAREALRKFSSIEPAAAPEGFQGELRPYQREGLGWLHFLQRFGFGGCLADDMGLGKTVQVLALLEERRRMREDPAAGIAPSLVVVPRSLVFNWKQEALRFTPRLRIIDHTGIERVRDPAAFAEYDVVLTTYGTLRSDIPHFKDFAFDYVILDEAQAIKNAGAQTTKAVRLLKGQHRLALSGTPVQNHLGELWSLFEVLNPGMLGKATAFRLVSTGARAADSAGPALLARALRPFILRRTKGQVARDLPARSEETVFCEMEEKQARDYQELREFYQKSLLKQVDNRGMNRSKIQVLEALLRLRQAACHPALIDPTRHKEPSAKLNVLLDQLDEVLDGGHKALVFSQFTSFLAIVRKRLDARHLRYEYLDGKTADRRAPVERFQGDPESRLFLVSLKAGGLGLNLTAAEYVFLLDPWWNPAIEAQAIDRAHRIGQSRRVFAYRLIAKDTVEEKVLALQEKKRELADSIIGEDNSLIRSLTRDDLALLLS
jgi:superfamily II DNA or RNA helicase